MRVLLPCALALSSLPALAQTAPALVPIDVFVHPDQYSNPKISPDGKHLAVTVQQPVGKRTVPMLNFYSVPEMKLESTVRVPLFTVPVDYDWVSGTRLVMQLGREVGSREAPQRTGEVVAMEFDASRHRYLYGYKLYEWSTGAERYGSDYGYAWPAFFPRERNNHIYLDTHLWDGKFSELYDLDSRNGIRKLLATVPTPDATFVMQNDGKPRFAMGSDEANYFELWRYDDGKDKWAVVPAKQGSQLAPQAFSADNQEFVALSAEEGGPFKVVRERLDTGARRVVAADPEGSVETLMYASSRTLPVAAFTGVGRPRVIYLELDHPDVAVHKSLSAAFPDATVILGRATDDGAKMIAHVVSDRDPGIYYLYDRKTAKAEELFASMEGIDPQQMAARRPISFAARDGMRLHGYLTMPVAKGERKPPLILMVHGGPHGVKDTWSFDTDAQFLANRGYAVLQVNYRGSDGRGNAFKRAGYRQWGGKIIDDLVDGVKWTVAQGEVDGARMCAYGASFGAYASLMLAAREPALFKCAVGYAGVYEPALIFQEEGVKGNARMTSTFTRYLGTDAAELSRYSPVQRAAAIKAGVLLIHGGKDKRAPEKHALLMKAALEKAGHPPEWYYVDYEGHGFYDTENQAEVYRRLEKFFAQYLGKPR